MRALFIFLLLLGSHGLVAQQVSYQRLDKASGLPSNTIYDLMQDQQGFIWLATDKGLYRYDGVLYQPYRNHSQNDKGLSNLMLDGAGRIWCQNFSGQFFFVEADSLRYCSVVEPLGSYYPAVMLNGFSLVNFGPHSLRVLDTRTLRLTNSLPLSYVHYSPYAFSDEQAIYLFSGGQQRALRVPLNGPPTYIPNEPGLATFYVVKVRKHTFLIPKADATRLVVQRPDGGRQVIELGHKGLIQNVRVINDRYLGLFCSAGFYLLDMNNPLPQRLSVQLPDKNCTGLMLDGEGNFWLATINSGLLLIPSMQVNVIAPGRPFTRLQALPHKRQLYFGTATGELARLDLTQGSTTPLYKGTSNTEVISLHYDTTARQLFFSSDLFRRWYNGRTDFSQLLSVKDIASFDQNRLAIAATGFLGVVSRRKPEAAHEINLSTARNRAVVVHPTTKTLYAATSKGFWQYPSGRPGSEIKADHESLSLSDLTLTDGPAPLVFAASTNNGIYAFEGARQTLHLTEKDGLADNAVYRIQAYKNQIWWLTEKAAQSFDLRTRTIRTYDRTDGLPDTDLKDLAVVDDMVYVATLSGLVRFPRNLPATNTHRPRLVVTRLLCNKQAFSLDKKPRFAYDQNNVEIHFSVLSFRSQGDVRVNYRINGQAWVTLDPGVRMLSLPSLAPDDYVVQIRVENEDGLSSQQTLTVKFVVQSPFWLSYPFLGALMLAIAGLVYGSNQRRLSRQQRESALQAEKAALQQELQKSRLTAIKSQMNPHFIFNALNTIQLYIYLNEKQQASSYLVKFSELTRMILDMSNDETVALADELKAIRLYLELEQMRFEDSLHCQLVVANDLDIDHIRIPSMLIQPYIENAIKHGLMHKKHDRHLLVDFRQTGPWLEVTIDDDGVGRQKSAEINQQRARRHESFATQANQKRLELLNDGDHSHIGIRIIDKYDAFHKPAGTTVILHIPVLT
ncbi:sensor histidine kinase [Rudanella lutea]|uniref:sensor histidine kinase n=1 Tax=Rudanella lutea TaxID=451374 RepID=UPI00036B56F3|nr:histidine kinase [Rudanella lutea]